MNTQAIKNYQASVRNKTIAGLTALLLLLNGWLPAAAAAPLLEAPRSLVVPAPEMPAAPVRRGSKQVRLVQPRAISAAPSDAEIERIRAFKERLVPMPGIEDRKENGQLATALQDYKRTSNLSFIERFRRTHPRSKWNPSLLLQSGLLYADQRYLSRALADLEAAWNATKAQTAGNQKLVGDRSISELLLLDARLGRVEQLEKLLAEIAGRRLTGSDALRAEQARGGLACMKRNPEIAFKCGPFAVNSILNYLRQESLRDPIVEQFPSTMRGTNLLQIKQLSEVAGLKMQLAKRSPGAKIVTPSIMHWTVEHFAAILQLRDGRYQVKDPTFDLDGDMWLPPDVVNRETDGYFLIPEGPLPSGWASLSEAEASQVWGRGGAEVHDDEAKTPEAPLIPSCPASGMAHAEVFAAQVTNSISDLPLQYTPPIGPRIEFALRYSHLEANQPTVYDLPNFGPDWTFKWLSYLTTDASQNVLVRVMGGGTERFNYTGNSSSPYYAHFLSHATITKLSSTSYRRSAPDGSTQLYNQPDGSDRIFMTECSDRQGNTVTLQYDEEFRLVTITDAIGQVSTINYVSDTSTDPGFYKIAGFEDPFGRTCSLTYNSENQLAAITDVIGLTSSFVYDSSSSFINQMKTPYGITSFYRYVPRPELGYPYTSDEPGRGLRIHFPDDTEMVIENALDDDLATYIWNREALQKYPLDPTNHDYTHCKIVEWFETVNSPRSMVPIVRRTKTPLTAPKRFTYPNQYPTSEYLPIEEGTLNEPLTITQEVSSGVDSTQSFQYNSLGHVTQSIDPIGREFTFTYASNGIDLLEVRETKGTDDFLVAKWTYNSAHLPLTAMNGSGRETTFTYNSFGEVTTVTDADSNTTTYTYDTDGYLTHINGPLSGSQDVTTLSYDGFGRLYTITDPNGYVVTFNYDAMNRLTKITYPDSTTEEVRYSRLDAVAMKDRIGRWTTNSFDNMQQLALSIDPAGRKTQFQWCSCGSVSALTDPAGSTTTWDHDLDGRIVTKTYEDDNEINYSYDSYRGLLSTRTDALGQVKTYSYNLDGSLSGTSYSNEVNDTSNVVLTYDANFPTLSTVQNGWGTITFGYNDYIEDPEDPAITGGGRLASVTNNVLSNSAITFTYDALGRITNRSINGTANSVTWSYDAISRVTSEANALGTFNFAYMNNTSGSSKGDPRLASITYPNSQVTNFSYLANSGDQRLEVIENLNPSSALLSKFTYGYNPAGEITSWRQQQGTRDMHQSLQYDLAGQLIGSLAGSGKSGPPYAEQFRYTYDLGSNRTSVQQDKVEVARLGGTVTASDVVTVTINDAALTGGSKSVSYTVQSGDTLTTIARELAAAITLDSDLAALGVNATSKSNVIFIRSLSPNITTFSKSTSGGASETITLGGPFNGTTNAVIGGTGTASDTVTITVIDSALTGGQKSKTYTVQSGDDAEDIATGLTSAVNGDSDLQGIKVSATSVGGVVSVNSLSANATTYSGSTSSGATATISLSPNANGAQTAVIAGSKTTGDQLTIQVFDAGLSGGSQSVTYTVLSGDTLSSIAAGLASAINANTSLSAIGVTASSTGTVLNLFSNSTFMTTYAKSTSGGATETIALGSNVGVTEASHNELNQLTALATGGPTRFEGTTNKPVKSVTVDGNAARLNWSKSFAGDADLASGADSVDIVGTDGDNNTKTNTYKLSTKGAASASLTYDANGNMTSDGTNAFHWDAEDRLIKIVYPGSNNRTEFTYDALGRCVQMVEITAGSTTSTKNFIWCETQRCEERNGSNTVTGQFFAMGQTDGTNDFYYPLDHLGSKREMTNSSGAIVARNSFTPFGRQTKLEGTSDADFGFAGMYRHARSGLNLTLFRAYHPSLGRWLSRDPLGESVSINRYVYTANDPIRFTDSLGLDYLLNTFWVPGHTFVQLINTDNGTGRTVGFYPRPNPGIPDNPIGIQKLQSLGQNAPGIIRDDSDNIVDAKLLRQDVLTEQQYNQATNYVKQQIDLANSGQKLYNLGSQCESFAADVRRAAGAGGIPAWPAPAASPQTPMPGYWPNVRF